jgi:hypothetical protein
MEANRVHVEKLTEAMAWSHEERLEAAVPLASEIYRVQDMVRAVVGTHDGPFHPDETMALAIVKAALERPGLLTVSLESDQICLYCH